MEPTRRIGPREPDAQSAQRRRLDLPIEQAVRTLGAALRASRAATEASSELAREWGDQHERTRAQRRAASKAVAAVVKARNELDELLHDDA